MNPWILRIIETKISLLFFRFFVSYTKFLISRKFRHIIYYPFSKYLFLLSIQERKFSAMIQKFSSNNMYQGIKFFSEFSINNHHNLFENFQKECPEFPQIFGYYCECGDSSKAICY